MRNLLLVVIIAFISCNEKKIDHRKKYSIIIERVSRTSNERNDKIDTILAATDEDAYDSCSGTIFGLLNADSLILNELKRRGATDYYSQLSGGMITGYKIINEDGLDVVPLVDKNIKRRIDSFWHERFAKTNSK